MSTPAPEIDDPQSGRRLTRAEIVAVILGAVGAIVLLVVATSSYGIGLNTDSVGYKTAADNLAAGEGLTWWGDPDFVAWPPLLPVVLAFGAWVSPLATEDVAVVVQGLLLVVIVLETAILLRRTVPDVRLRVLGILVAGLAPATLAMARMLWTEITFISIVLGALIALQRAVDRGDHSADAGGESIFGSARQRRWFAASVVLVWLAFLTRYTGSSLLVVGGVTFLFLPRTRPLKGRLSTTAAFLVAAAVVPAIWLARNQEVSGTLMGPRATTDQSLPANAKDAIEVFGQYASWYPSGLHLALGIVAVLGLVALLVGAWRSEQPPRKPLTTVLGSGGQLLPVAVFVGVYVVMMLATRTLVGFGSLSDRLLAPVFIPLVVLSLSWLGTILASPRVTERVALGVVAAVAVWVVLLIASSTRVAIVQAGDGVVLEGADYEQADLASMVRDAKSSGCRLYTNSRPAVFLWSGTVAEQTPRRTKNWSNERVGDVAAFERTVERGPVCLLWVDLDERDHFLTPPELGQRFELVPLREDGPATLYEVRP